MDQLDGEHESISPSGRVQDLRRQWGLHEDEALAHKLQDEEIVQHYAGNRTRNSIVRADGPKAREEQKREEEEALEQRLRHLSLLQRQAEKDALLAQNLAKKYQSEDVKSSSSRENVPVVLETFISEEIPKVDICSLGAACQPQPSTSRSAQCRKKIVEDEDYFKELQEKRDAELAIQVQEELEQYEKDRLLAIEAQDREFARVLHEKEKARLKRAKERARLKAEAAAAANQGDGQDSPISTTSSEDHNNKDNNKVHQHHHRKEEIMHTEDKHHHRRPIENSSTSSFCRTTPPPRIPEKPSADGPIFGFKAHPKKLPPQPVLLGQSPPSRMTDRYRSDNNNDPVPPYMPILGFNRNSPKRQP